VRGIASEWHSKAAWLCAPGRASAARRTGKATHFPARTGPALAALIPAQQESERESSGAGRKPGSVVDSHSSGPGVTARLERPTRTRRGQRHCVPIWSCSGWGLPCRRVLPRTRCALTAPFHPYRRVAPLGRFVFCCTFRRLTPPRCYLAPCPVEPGLSSPHEGAARLPGPLRAGF
jgi:hypothetical protein